MIPTVKNIPEVNPTKLRVVVYGPPKVGKSTFAIQNPKALVLDADNRGTQFLPCFRVDITSWAHLKETLGELNEQVKKGECQFDTIVFDTVDMIHSLCRYHVCKQENVGHESEDKAFGRIWDLVKGEFMRCVAFIGQMNMGLWMISHSVQREQKIDGVKRSVTTTSLSGATARVVHAMADHIVYIDTDDNGKRTLYNVPQDGVEAGGRIGIRQNIKFETEAEAYSLFLKNLTSKE
jgi:hypothetical protein